jgi:hypothetical protein
MALVAEQRLPAARGEDVNFYHGKLQACRFFFRWELPKVEQQLALLASIDTTTLDMQPDWF